MDIAKPGLMTDEQLKHLALIVHTCYGSFDLAARCISLLAQRNRSIKELFIDGVGLLNILYSSLPHLPDH
ncbi:MAG: hypothetical protein WCG16_04670 [Methylococcales bacterium]